MMTRKRMQRQSLSFAVIFLITFISGIVVSGPSTPLRRRVRHHNIKVRINATGDTIVLKFLLPNAHTKLEGYILGYGSRLFSKQFIQLPENGLPFVKEFDAEPKYLIAVKPIQINEVKKYCKGKVELEKPLNLVVGPVTPSSVLLSWGDTLKNPYTGNILKECLEEGHYTVRYREKDKKWSYQTCPTSDTVIDNLKPNAVYEFGVKPISKEGSGEWSKPVVHNTSNVKLTEKPIKTIIKHPINPAKPLGPGPHSSSFVSPHVHHNKTQGGEELSRSVLPLDITPTMASLPVSQTYMAKCEEHHHNQPQEIPQSKPHSHLPKQKQHPKHTPLNDSQKQLPSTFLPQKHNPKKPPPDTDPYPKFNPTPQTKPQTKPQPTLQPQSQMSVQPVNQLPSDPKLITDPHLRFQPTLKPLQSHSLSPEQLHLQPTPNLILQTSQQTQTLQPNSPTNSQTKLMSETTPSNNIQQPIYPQFQAQPRMPKPPPLSTSTPILETQSEDHQRSKPSHQNELQPELQPWTEQQFHEFTSEAQPQRATDSIFQTQKQTEFLPTTETQTQHWPTSQAKPQKETQTHLNKILFPQTENEKQPQTTNKSTVQTKRPPQLTLSPIASNEHQVQWQPTLEPFVQTQQQIKPVTQPITIAPLPLKSTSQNQLQNREQHQTEPPIQFQFTSEPKAQDEKQVQATLQPKSQTEQQPQLHPTSKLKTQKRPYPQAPTTRQKPQPTIKPIFHIQPPPQPTLLSNIQNDPYPESQPAYLPKSHPQQYPQSQPTSKSIHQTQPQLHQTSTINLQTELFPQSQTESQFRHQPQQPQSTVNSILHTQEIFQLTSHAKHQNEPTSYQQSQKTHLYPSQTHPTVMPILNTQPEVETTVQDMYKLQQPESEPIFQPKPQLQPKVQTQPSQQSQLSPEQPHSHSTLIPILQKQTPPNSESPVKPKNDIYPKTQPPFQARPNPQQHAQPHSQTVPHPKPQNKSHPQSKPMLQDKFELHKPQHKPTAIPPFQIQSQTTSHLQSLNEPYTESQPTYHAKHYPDQYPQLQPVSQPIHQTQPQPTSKVKLKNDLYPQSQPESQFHHQPQQPKPTLNSFLESQSISPNKYQNEPYPQSHQTFQTQPHLYQSQPRPSLKPILHTQPQVQPTVQESKIQQPESKLIFNPKIQLKPHKEPYPQPQPTVHSEQPQSQSTSQSTVQNGSYRKAQPSLQAETQAKKLEPTKTSQQPWNEFHSPPQPTDQVVPISHHQRQFQPALETIVQTQPYKQSQPSPQQQQIHSTSIPILQKQTTTKSASPVKPKNDPYPKSQPTLQAIPNPQQHPQPSPPQSEPQNESQAKLYPHEPKPTAIPTFLSQSQPTLHIQSHSKPYPESQPLVQTTLHLQQQPQPKLTLKPTLQTDLQPQSTPEFKPHNQFHSQSQPAFPSISQPQQSISTSRPMHQTKIPTQAASQPTPKNEPLPTLKQRFQDKYQSEYQHYQPTFNPTPQTQSQKILPPVLNIQPQTTPSHQSKPENGPQPQHQQLFNLEAHTQKPQLSVTLYPILQTKPQQTQQPTYQTQTPLQPHSQTQHSQYQSTSQPSHTKHNLVFTSIFQIQPHSTPHPILQMQSQTQPGNKPILQTRLQESIPQPTHHPQPETKQQSLSHPTSQSLHQHKPQQTMQPTSRIPNQQAFQPTHKNLLETQSKSELNSQKESQPQQQIPTHFEPQIPKQPQKKTNGKNSKKPRPKPKFHPRPPTRSQPPTKMQQPQPTSIFQNKSQSQSHPASQHHRWTQEQQKMQSTSKPLLQTQQQKLQFTFQNQTYTTLQPKVWITPALEHIPKTQPQSASKHETESKPKPEPNFNTLQRQTEPTFSPKLQKQSKPTFQPIGQTQSQFPKRHKFKPWRKIQKLRSTTPQPLSHIQTQTQTHSKTKMTTEPEAEKKVHITMQPNVYSHKTVQPQPILQKQPQLQPTSQSVPESQSFSQPQPRSTTTTKMQTTSKPMLQTHLSQHKLTPHPKLHVQDTTMLSVQLQTRASAERTSHSMTDSQSVPLPHLSSKTQSQPETVLKQHSTTWPQVQPQPGLQTESQTRTYTDPTKITPGQTLLMAPSPPEEGKPLPRPELATENAGSYNEGTGVLASPKGEAPHSPVSSSAPPTQRNTPLSHPRVPQRPSRPFSTSKTFINSHITSTTKATGMHHRGNDLSNPVRSEKKPSKDNQDKPRDPKLRVKEDILENCPAVTPRPKQERRQETTTAAPTVNSTNFNISENSTVFSALPTSEVDVKGKKRFVAPHVIYKTDKKPEEPCSITSSLSYFPDEEANDQNVTSPPRIPPSNLTVVTVEGCPSFVILDWQKSDNETTEYEILSTTTGESGVEKSVVTTNQTHTAVENLKPESNYEFTVTPKNELGTGPATDPVSFSTESADPRVSEYVSGKNSIWSDFPFQFTDDAYSECHGRMFVKRTWYRKFVGIQLCNSLRYQIYLSDSLNGKFYNIGDLTGEGEDHCQFVDSFLDGNTGSQIPVNELPKRPGFYRAMRHEPVTFGEVGGNSHATYVGWYECGTPIPGKW